MSLWQRFRRKTAFEQRVALESVACLLVTKFALRVAGFRRWHEFVISESDDRASAKDAIQSQSIARMEQAAARHLPFRFNCLDQSLALLWLLRRHGQGGELRVGVRKESGNFEAHAWVEANGAILNEPDSAHRHFVAFEQPIQPAGTRLP